MYTHGLSGLGEEPGFFDQGGMFESITKLVSTGVSTGLKVADQVKLYNQSKTNASAAQQMATSVAQAQQLAYAVPVGTKQEPGFLDNWGMPLLLGGAGLVALLIFTKKK